MSAISYIFNLHCKGKQENITAFKQRLQEAIDSNEVYTSDYNLDLSLDSMYIYIEQTRGVLYKELLPVMEDFSEDKGAALSFFFDLIEADNSDTVKWCGYYIFKNGARLTATKEYTFNVHAFPSNEGNSWNKLQEALNKAHEGKVKPALLKWQNKGQR